ncbi:MAG: Fic family protein [Candidatus Levybacteria bacterium]|nr:Fic family protein [Candidatus Levybacteria bacterium]
MSEGEVVIEPDMSRDHQDVDSKDFRRKTLPALEEFVKRSELTIGSTPEQRVAWLTQLSPHNMSDFLIQLNATARGITDQHTFDGEGIQAGTAGASIPPDQADKEPLLHYALAETQMMSSRMLADGMSHQEVLDRMAVVLPVIVNKLHLFANGNGRTSRVFRMLIRDGVADADTSIDGIVNKTKDEVNYDASPRPKIDYVITNVINRQHGTRNIKLEDDLDGDSINDEYTGEVDDVAKLDPDLARIRSDMQNFQIIARDFAKKYTLLEPGEADSVKVSHKAVLTLAGSDPDKKSEFMEMYRHVRKERVNVLTDALTEKKDILIYPEILLSIINSARAARQQPPLTGEHVDSVAKAVTAYMEAKSPTRL